MFSNKNSLYILFPEIMTTCSFHSLMYSCTCNSGMFIGFLLLRIESFPISLSEWAVIHFLGETSWQKEVLMKMLDLLFFQMLFIHTIPYSVSFRVLVFRCRHTSKLSFEMQEKQIEVDMSLINALRMMYLLVIIRYWNVIILLTASLFPDAVSSAHNFD